MSKDFVRNMFENKNVLCVSSELRQQDINTPVEVDFRIDFEKGNIAQIEPIIEVNDKEVTGYEEATESIYKGNDVAGFNIARYYADPQFLAFCMAYGLSAEIETVSVGATGKKHTLTPGETVDPHKFTAVFKKAEIEILRLISLMLDGVEITFAKGEAVKATASVKGTGKFERNWIDEKITAAGNVTELEAASAVKGNATKNVHGVFIRKADGALYALEVSSVSGRRIKFSAGANDGVSDREYRVVYIKNDCAWADNLPVRINEGILKVSDLQVLIGGKFDGSDITGGVAANHEIQSVVYKLNQPLTIDRRPKADGDDSYSANYAARNNRDQVITIDRDFKDVIMQARMIGEDYFSLKIKCEAQEFELGINYLFQMIFPRISVRKASQSVDNSIMKETLDLPVYEDPTGAFKSVYVTVVNKQEKVAALV